MMQVFTSAPASRLGLTLPTMSWAQSPELAGLVSTESGRWREHHGTCLYRLCNPLFSSPISMVTCTSEAGDSRCFCGSHSFFLSVVLSKQLDGVTYISCVSLLWISWYFSSTFFSSPRFSFIVIFGGILGEEKKNVCVQFAMFNQKLLKPIFN